MIEQTKAVERKQAEEALRMTEKKPAEEALRESEERFRHAMEATNDGLWDWNVKTGEVYYSPAYSRILGYEPAEFANHVQSWIDFLHPDDRAKALSVNQACIENRIPAFEVEFRMRTKGGEWRTILGRGKAVCRDADGRATRMIGTHVDITERKRAEEALKRAHDELERRVETRTAELTESNEELRAIYDGMPDGLLIADAETKRFVRANSSICEMLGYSEPELLSMSVSDIHPAKDLPAVIEAFQAQVEGRLHVASNLPVLRRDGRIVYADITSNRILYNGRTCLMGFFRDVTERKRIADALQQSHDELRTIYDHIVDGIIIADAEKACPLRVNPAYCRMLGYSEAEAYSLSPERVHPPDVLPRVWEHLDEVKKGRVAAIEDLPFLRKDGAIIYADVVSGPIRYNERPCWISFFHDVTERKRDKEALAREHRTLKHLLQSSDHERQLIAYEIHDGLAQQLAGAIMQFETFAHQKEREPRLASDAFEAGMTMLRQGHFEARRLISGVRPPILDEAGIVAAIAHLVNEERHKKGPKIEYLSKVEFERLAPILENAMYRIVQEALNNACRHSKSKRVHVELVQHGDEVRIEVRDRGIGFQPEDIGESHFGVAGIRERVRLLGGGATIASAPGKGTRVVVKLPIVLRSQDEDGKPGQEGGRDDFQ
jgi:PAS domain S-box-containing protein